MIWKKCVSLLLISILLFSAFPNGMTMKVDADSSVPESIEATKVIEQLEATAVPEETEIENLTEEAEKQTVATMSTESTEFSEPSEPLVPTEFSEPSVASEPSDPIEPVPTETVCYMEPVPEDREEIILEEPELEERFPAITVTDPAPMKSPVAGSQVVLRTQKTKNQSDNLILQKTVADHGNETYTLTLESYATGTASVVTKVPVPSDVVLVLDESGSMNDCIECGHEMTENCSSLEGDCLHKVYLSGLNTAKKYKTYYKDNTHRIIGYCKSCQKWYTGGPFQKCSSHSGLGYWVAFSSQNDTASYIDKVYKTQFYESCDHDTQRMDALKGAVTNFLDKMYVSALGADKKAGTDDDIDHHVAIVGYDNDTPARIYTPGKSVTSDYVLADSAENAVGTLKNIVTDNAVIQNGLSKVRVRSATATNRGMEAANFILSNNKVPSGQNRNRVVILFTDGSPGSGYENNITWANSAIQYAYSMKHNLGTTVYTIGLFWGADASDPANLPTYDVTANGVNNLKFFQNGNRFLHLVSSNYPNAISLDNTGEMASISSGGSYYLSADDETGLYTIFGKLSNVVTPGSTTITLNEKAVVKDFITPYFEILDPEQITAWTESYKGNELWEKDLDSISTVKSGPLSIKISSNTVSVSNFNYAQFYVADDKTASGETTYRGKKLVLQIDIQPIPGFLGGDNIVTNTNESAIYARDTDSTPVKHFPIPKVDITVKQIVPVTNEKDIYLSQLSSIPEIFEPDSYQLNENTYKIDSLRNGYADVIYTIEAPDGVIIVGTIPAGAGAGEIFWNIPDGSSLEQLLYADTVYPITCQVISKNNSNNQAVFQKRANVNVYIPEITFWDSTIYLGQTADYGTNGGTVRWIHDGNDADSSVMGNPPELQYTYSPESGAFEKDTSIKVQVISKENPIFCVPQDQDITRFVLFLRDKCTFKDCIHKIKGPVDGSKKDRINFMVHIRTFDLRIEKKGADNTLDPNCSFLFRITGPNEFTMDVVIHGNEYALIKNLPIGEYTIKELCDWSWRYEPENLSQTICSTDIKNGMVTLTYSNIRKWDKWLDGEYYVENRFTGTQEQGGAAK